MSGTGNRLASDAGQNASIADFFNSIRTKAALHSTKMLHDGRTTGLVRLRRSKGVFDERQEWAVRTLFQEMNERQKGPQLRHLTVMLR